MSIFLAIILPALAIVAAFVLMRLMRSEKEPDQRKMDLGDLIKIGPEAYFNLVKEALPKDLGLIYSVEACKYDTKFRDYIGTHQRNIGWYADHDIILVKLTDAVTNQKFADHYYNETLARKGDVNMTVGEFCDRIDTKIRELYSNYERNKLTGKKEIVY